MNKKVLIFTNFGKWQNIYTTQQEQESFAWPDFNNNFGTKYTILKCTGSDPALEVVEDFAKGCVFLVFDEVDKDTLLPMIDNCPNDKFYVLFHDKGHYQNELKERCVCLKGNHSGNTYDHYRPTFDLLKERNIGEESLRENIIKSIFKDLYEIVFQFLSECSFPHNDKSDGFINACDALQASLEDDKLNGKLNEFIELYSTKDNIKDYIEELESLRKDLMFYVQQH